MRPRPASGPQREGRCLGEGIVLFFCRHPVVTSPRESCRKLEFKKVSQRIMASSDEPPLSRYIYGQSYRQL